MAEAAAHANGTFVTMLRRPASRVVSAFHHQRAGGGCILDCHPDGADHSGGGPCATIREPAALTVGLPACRALLAAGSARAYSALAAARGCATKMLLGVPCHADVELTAADVGRAIQRLRGFAFVRIGAQHTPREARIPAQCALSVRR